MADELLTVPQVAEVLGVHRSRVTVLIREGRIQAERFGKAYMVRRSALDTFKKAPKRRGGRPRKR
jgi:excisionase family DNA binding protein